MTIKSYIAEQFHMTINLISKIISHEKLNLIP